MDGLPEIRIECQGATTVTLDDLHDLQGNLKDLSEGNYVKLRNSIIEYGFSFPIFFWQDEQGTKWIIDAHQRNRTLRQMQEEGYTIPALPADPIFAKSKSEAKRKLLLLNSKYGKITREGFDEFIAEEGAEVPDDMEDLLELPEIAVYTGGTDDTTGTDDEGLKQKQLREITCPACAAKFTI